MRVLLVQGAAHRGGAERILLALARHLPARGIHPVVGFLADGPFVDEVRSAGVEIHMLGQLPRAREVWKAGSLISAIDRGARAAGADVILANGEKLAPYVGWAARRTGRHSVVWLHDAPLRSPSSAALQLTMRASPHDLVIAGSSWMAERFRATWKMPVRCIPHGIDIDVLPKQPAPLRAIAGWPDGAETVVLVGRLQRWKGADVFLRAAARVSRLRPDARFALVGGALYGWELDFAEHLPQLAAELGLADRVWFAGHRDDALDLMAAADVVAHCSRRPEPLGLVVPEAMALGRAVVATRSLGPEEVVDDGVTGLLTDPDDDAALAAAVAGLLADPARRETMGAAAAQSIRANWSAPVMADRFAAAFRELVPG